MRCPTLSELPSPPRGRSGWPWTEESPELAHLMPDGSPWPRISVVTPSYNQAKFIEMTIRSVLLQGYPDLEYIVIDGGSTDGSVDIIRKYEKWLAYWVSEPDRGQSHAINKGFEKATGEIYTWLNSDDYLLKDALGHVAVAYRHSPDAGAWCGGCVRVKPNGKKVWVRWPKRLDLEGLANWNENWFGQPACFFSAEAWRTSGPLDESLQYGMDFDFWLRLAKDSCIAQVGSELAVDRAHPDAKTERNRGYMYATQFLIQFRHGYEHVAVQDMTRWMNEYLQLRRTLDRAYGFPLVKRVVAPLLQKVLGVL